MMACGLLSLGRSRWIAIVTSLAASALVFLAAEVTHGQTPIPTISSVDPTSPYCILQRSEVDTDRLLTITGEDLTAFGPDGRIQFLNTHTQEETPVFRQNIDWRDPRRISIDMSDVDLRFRSDRQLMLQVRVISAESEQLASEWSDEFTFARNRSACGTDARFPPTSPIRGIEGDLWADVVLGEVDFTQTGENRVVPFKVFNPGGVVVDRSVEPGRAYVWDSSNSRILGIDLSKCYAATGACAADIILGQPSGFDHSACNGDNAVQNFPYRAIASAETLCGARDIALSPGETHTFVTMAVDNRGSLYVPDSVNHRILKYENPFETDSIADRVWGQADFSGMACNRGRPQRPTAESLCFHSPSNQSVTNWYGNGVEIDAQGNMWVADGGNNRVLRFPADLESGEIAKTADLVIGQRDLRSSVPGNSLRRLQGPSAVRMSKDGQLYVADTVNDRVLVFEPPFESGMEASLEFGRDFYRPTALEIDPLGRGIWVVNAGNRMIELWDDAGGSVVQVLGKDSYRPDRNCGEPLFELPRAPRMCQVAGSVGIDNAGNILVPVFLDTADVFVFSTLPDTNTGAVGNAVRRVFYPPIKPNLKDRVGLHSPKGIAIWQDQLIISDIGRVLFWNGLEDLYNGRPADGVVGDEQNEEEWDHCCGRIKVDDAGRLWVLGLEGRHFLDIYELPLTAESVPIHTVWKRDYSLPVLGSDDVIELGERVFGIAPVGNGDYVWLSDTDNHRVIRIRDPLLQPTVDVVLGQENARDTSCNQGRFRPNDRAKIKSGAHMDALCFPGALSVDKIGNLFVSDHSLEVDGNQRLLVFSPLLTPANNTSAIFAPSATMGFFESAPTPSRLFVGRGADRFQIRETHHTLTAATWEPAFDSTNRMVVGYNAYVGPRFVGVYDDPLGPNDLPTSYLYDFGGMYYTAAFDRHDNLYVGDINRGRLLIYKNPFGNTPSEELRQPDVAEGPVPSHPVSIQSAHPSFSYCLLRRSSRDYETTLQLEWEGLEGISGLTLEFRKVTSAYRDYLYLRPEFFSGDGSTIRLNQRHLWQRLWPHIDKVTLTVRLLAGGSDGHPISNWSPAFLLANDASACGIALPTPTPTPTPVPTETPTPSPTPVPTNTPTPTVTSAPLPSPTPSPTEMPVPPTQENPISTPGASAEPTAPPASEPASGIRLGQWLPVAIIGILAATIGIAWRRRR